MTRCGSSLTISRVKRIPRKKECLLHLSDGSELRVLEQDMARFSLDVGQSISNRTTQEIKHSYDSNKARESALRLLKVRPRTEGELRRELGRRGFAREALNRLMDELRRDGLVDDYIFTQLWIKEKMRGRASGRRLISKQLEAKGVDRVMVDEQLERIYRLDKETEIARDIAIKRLAKMTSVPHRNRKRKVYDHLLRRGFNSDIASDAACFAFEHTDGEDTR